MQTNETAEWIDKPARVAIHAMNNFLDIGSIAGKYADYEKVLPHLLNEHETIIILLQKNIETYDEKMCNTGTIVFLTKLMRQHQDIAGILRRCINKTILI